MYLIYKILKEIRYIMRSKSMKRLITLAILIVLIALLGSRVFAFEVQTDTKLFEVEDVLNDGLNTGSLNDYYFFMFQDNYYKGEYTYTCYFFPKTTYNDNSFFYDNDKYYHCTIEGESYFYFQRYKCTDLSTSTPLLTALTGEYNYGRYHNTYSNILNFFNIENNKQALIYTNFYLPSKYEHDFENYEVFISPTEQTQGSVRIYTNWFNPDYQSYYAVSIVTNPDTSESLPIEMETEESSYGNRQYRYFFDVTSNGDYDIVFSFTYNDYRNIKVIRQTISNITTQQGGGTGGNEGGGTGERRSTRRRNIRTAVVEQKEEKLGAVLTIPPKTILKILMKFNRGLLTQILQSIIKHKQ